MEEDIGIAHCHADAEEDGNQEPHAQEPLAQDPLAPYHIYHIDAVCSSILNMCKHSRWTQAWKTIMLSSRVDVKYYAQQVPTQQV